MPIFAHLSLRREALQQFSARQLRLMFIMNPWNKTVSYGETMRAEMRAREQAIKNFFQNVHVALREAAGKEAQTSAKWEVSLEWLLEGYILLIPTPPGLCNECLYSY